jgi:hypothetical protein
MENAPVDMSSWSSVAALFAERVYKDQITDFGVDKADSPLKP